MMARRFSKKLCPRFQTAVDILCKRWTGMIIQVLLQDSRRFNEVLDQLEVVSDRMLSERLKELEAEGIVVRRVLPEPPVRVEYSLTEKGRDLAPIIRELEGWSERWILETAFSTAAAKDVESDRCAV
jgi:DNA-binding HxlR family transcriptional regulator